MPVGHLYVFFEKNTYLSLWLIFRLGYLVVFFFFLFFFCLCCLFFLEIKPLLVALFANIFSHSIGCFLVLFMVSKLVIVLYH